MNGHHQMSLAMHSVPPNTVSGGLCVVDLLLPLLLEVPAHREKYLLSYKSSVCKGKAVQSLLFEQPVVEILAVCHSLAHSGHLGSLGFWDRVVRV